MKQAYILPIQKQWVDMIRSGVKEFEFRPYALEVGKKVYIYESKGKKTYTLYHPNTDDIIVSGITKRKVDEFVKSEKIVTYEEHYEGAGAIVGEFVVEECYEVKHFISNEIDTQGSNLNYAEFYNEYGVVVTYSIDNYLKQIGYNGQKYAIKISQLKFYDKPIPKESFELFNKPGKCVTFGPQRALKVVEQK